MTSRLTLALAALALAAGLAGTADAATRKHHHVTTHHPAAAAHATTPSSSDHGAADQLNSQSLQNARSGAQQAQ